MLLLDAWETGDCQGQNWDDGSNTPMRSISGIDNLLASLHEGDKSSSLNDMIQPRRKAPHYQIIGNDEYGGHLIRCRKHEDCYDHQICGDHNYCITYNQPKAGPTAQQLLAVLAAEEAKKKG